MMPNSKKKLSPPTGVSAILRCAAVRLSPKNAVRDSSMLGFLRGGAV
jgi:hypothetical protein